MKFILMLIAGALWGSFCARREWSWRAVLVGALAIAVIVAGSSAGS